MLHGSSKQPQRVTPFNATTTSIIIPPHPTPPPHPHTARAWRATWIFKTTTMCHTLQCNYNVYNHPAPPHPPTPHPHSARVTCYMDLQNNHNVSHPWMQLQRLYLSRPAPPPHPTQRARDLLLQITSKQPQRVTRFNATTTFIIIPPHPTQPSAWRVTNIRKVIY